jgi:hypothetical protein
VHEDVARAIALTVTFTVDGRPTVDTGYRSGDEGDPLDLTVR